MTPSHQNKTAFDLRKIEQITPAPNQDLANEKQDTTPPNGAVQMQSPMPITETPVAETNTPAVTHELATPTNNVAQAQELEMPAHKGEAQKTYTILEYAEKTAKSKLWGSSDYPENAFASALLQREFQKRFVSDDKKNPTIEVDKIDSKEEKLFRIKVGKFEFSRRRK
jgi:hypothetical protein